MLRWADQRFTCSGDASLSDTETMELTTELFDAVPAVGDFVGVNADADHVPYAGLLGRRPTTIVVVGRTSHDIPPKPFHDVRAASTRIATRAQSSC